MAVENRANLVCNVSSVFQRAVCIKYISPAYHPRPISLKNNVLYSGAILAPSISVIDSEITPRAACARIHSRYLALEIARNVVCNAFLAFFVSCK